MTVVDGYARAIVDVASGEDVLEDVESELVAFSKVLGANPSLLQGMADPGVPAVRRQAMIEHLIGATVSRHTTSLISFIVGAGQTRNMVEIIDRSLDFAAETRNRAIAEVKVAVAMTDDQRTRMRETLERVTGKKIDLRVSVDPSILGGVWAKVGDNVIDGSFRARLDRARTDLRHKQ